MSIAEAQTDFDSGSPRSLEVRTHALALAARHPSKAECRQCVCGAEPPFTLIDSQLSSPHFISP